jgi:hypothetical protein
MNIFKLSKVWLNDIYIKNCIGKFSIQNCLKEVDALSSLLFKSALEYAIRMGRAVA